MRVRVIFLIVFFSACVCFGQSAVTDCPTILIEGQAGIWTPGEEMNYTAKIVFNKQLPDLKYNWSISKGKIVRGNGTPHIVVVQSKEEWSSELTVTLDVEGFHAGCPASASDTAEFIIEPGFTLFDDYGPITLADEKVRIQKFLDQLQQDNNASGVMIVDTENQKEYKAAGKRIKALYRYWHSKGVDLFDRVRIAINSDGYSRTSLNIVPAGSITNPSCPSTCTWLSKADIR